MILKQPITIGPLNCQICRKRRQLVRIVASDDSKCDVCFHCLPRLCQELARPAKWGELSECAKRCR